MRPGIVELGGLADDDRPRADHQYRVRARRPGTNVCYRRRPTNDQVEEFVEDQLVVLRSRTTFRMKLHRADRKARMHQPLDRSVVQIAMTDDESAVPRQALAVDLELVVLGGHGHATRTEVHHRVVSTVVAEREP